MVKRLMFELRLARVPKGNIVRGFKKAQKAAWLPICDVLVGLRDSECNIEKWVIEYDTARDVESRLSALSNVQTGKLL